MSAIARYDEKIKKIGRKFSMFIEHKEEKMEKEKEKPITVNDLKELEKMKWTANIEKLQQFKLKFPAYWTVLVDLYNTFSANKTNVYTVINDHSRYTVKRNTVDHLGFCFKVYKNQTTGETSFGSNTMFEENPNLDAWVFLYYGSYAQCKNPFYIKDGDIHESTTALGRILTAENCSGLEKGCCLVEYPYGYNKEDPFYETYVVENTFVLPINVFMNVMEQEKIDFLLTYVSN